MAPRLEVDTAQLKVVGNKFTALGGELQAAVSPMESGPEFQPSSAAVTETAVSANHVTRVAGFRLNGYGINLNRAAAAYDATDTAMAGKLAATMKRGG